MIEFPASVIAVFVIMIVLSTIGITCCVIDTVLKVKEHFMYIDSINKAKECFEQVSSQWGEMPVENSTLGTSEEQDD